MGALATLAWGVVKQSAGGWLLSVLPYLIAGASALALLYGIYDAGYRSAQNECNAAALRAQLAIAQADLANAQKARDDEAARATTLDTALQSNEENMHALERVVAARPAVDRCALSDRDRVRLRAVRGD